MISTGAPVIVAVAQALVQLLQQGLGALRRLRKKESVSALSGCLLRLDPAVWLLLWSCPSSKSVNR